MVLFCFFSPKKYLLKSHFLSSIQRSHSRKKLNPGKLSVRRDEQKSEQIFFRAAGSWHNFMGAGPCRFLHLHPCPSHYLRWTWSRMPQELTETLLNRMIAAIEESFPRTSPKGRPRTPLKTVVRGIYYRLRTAAQWRYMPREYGAPSTLHTWMVRLARTKSMKQLWKILVNEARAQGRLNEDAYLLLSRLPWAEITQANHLFIGEGLGPKGRF